MNVNVNMYRENGKQAIEKIRRNMPRLDNNGVVARACMLTSIPHIVMWCLMGEMFGITDEIKNKINRLKKFYVIDTIISDIEYNI